MKGKVQVGGKMKVRIGVKGGRLLLSEGRSQGWCRGMFQRCRVLF